MAIAFNPAAPQAQTATINPFQQRNDDVRTDESKDRTQTRPSSASASESQGTDTKTRKREDQSAANEDKRDTAKTGNRRGSLLDVTV